MVNVVAVADRLKNETVYTFVVRDGWSVPITGEFQRFGKVISPHSSRQLGFSQFRRDQFAAETRDLTGTVFSERNRIGKSGYTE